MLRNIAGSVLLVLLAAPLIADERDQSPVASGLARTDSTVELQQTIKTLEARLQALETTQRLEQRVNDLETRLDEGKSSRSNSHKIKALPTGYEQVEVVPTNHHRREMALPCGDCSSSCDFESGCFRSCCCGCCPTWTVTVDAIWLNRDTARSQPLVQSFPMPQVGRRTLFDANQISFNHHAGIRLGAERCLSGCRSLEVSWLGWDSGKSSRVFTSAGLDTIPIGNDLRLGQAAGDRTVFSYLSELDSVEVNIWQTKCQGWGVGAGFRYFRIEEDFTASNQPMNAPLGQTRDYFVGADNDLYGFQLTGRSVLWRCGDFSLRGGAKAGVYRTDADYTLTLGQNIVNLFPNVPLGASSGDTNHTSFVGDLQLNADYAISCNWSLRAGYNLLWIQGIAQATDQIDLPSTRNRRAPINTNGRLLLNGGFVGLEYRH